MNLIELWFGIVERQAVRRGVFTSVKDLNSKIRACINGWNLRCHPFLRTKSADEVLAKANRLENLKCGPLDRCQHVQLGSEPNAASDTAGTATGHRLPERTVDQDTSTRELPTIGKTASLNSASVSPIT